MAQLPLPGPVLLLLGPIASGQVSRTSVSAPHELYPGVRCVLVDGEPLRAACNSFLQLEDAAHHSNRRIVMAIGVTTFGRAAFVIPSGEAARICSRRQRRWCRKEADSSLRFGMATVSFVSGYRCSA